MAKPGRVSLVSLVASMVPAVATGLGVMLALRFGQRTGNWPAAVGIVVGVVVVALALIVVVGRVRNGHWGPVAEQPRRAPVPLSELVRQAHTVWLLAGFAVTLASWPLQETDLGLLRRVVAGVGAVCIVISLVLFFRFVARRPAEQEPLERGPGGDVA